MKESAVSILCLMLHLKVFAACSEIPVSDFQMSLFAPNGYKSWSITGKEGCCSKDQDVIDIIDMRLDNFSDDGKGVLESTVLSPSAKIFPKARVASGNDFVTVFTENYNLLGKDWYYDGVTQKIRVNENVRVTFFNSIMQKKS